MTKKKKRNSYTAEFKRRAVLMAFKEGADLGISPQYLSQWRSKFKKSKDTHKHAFAYYLVLICKCPGQGYGCYQEHGGPSNVFLGPANKILVLEKWLIEVKKASCLAAEMPFYIYSPIQLDPERFGGKEDDSVDLILARIRENSLNDSIEALTALQKPKRLEQLKARRSKKNTSLKPVDKIAVAA